VKVAMDVRVRPGEAGGVAPAVRSLVSALGRLEDGPETYTIVVGSQEQADWLAPLSNRQRVVLRPQEARHPWLRPVWPLVRRVQRTLTLPRHWPEVPLSDGFYESLGCDLIHFPTQSFTVCALPAIYNPIDLQHLHYPQFFDAWVIAWRETIYRAGCNLAQALIVNSEWIKQDVIRNYRVDPAKIHVIAEASPTTVLAGLDPARLDEVRSKYSLDATFILYPAVTWPHKNHVRLFEALAYLRDQRGLRLPLVCTGSLFQPFWPELESALARLQLASQVRFLGHVPEADLRALYQLATMVALPSLFEANSLPVFEAWLAGTPVTCSNTTGLPEQVGDAALLFEPHDPAAIADALAAIVTDSELRRTLRDRGRGRSQKFSWEKTARAYRALYRKVAGRNSTEEDRTLLGLP
jgi:glycosyltransferase involved in cell wall biosynthesis